MRDGEERLSVGSATLLVLVACQSVERGDASLPTDDGAVAPPDDGGISARDDGGDPLPDANTHANAGARLFDAAPGGAGLGCAGRTDLLFCEDFESGELDRAIWTSVRERNGGSVRIDSERVREGSHALHATVVDQATTTAMIGTQAPFPVAGNHFFGRAYIYIPSTIPFSHNRLMTTSGQVDGSPARFTLDLGRNSVLNHRYAHRSTPHATRR